MRQFLLVIAGVTFVGMSTYAKPDCLKLKGELKSLERAQQEIINSLLMNHQTFALTLEEYSDLIKTKQKPPLVLQKNMRNTASAIQKRGVHGKKLAEKLNLGTKELFNEVSACLH